jgi:hypothetical protein
MSATRMLRALVKVLGSEGAAATTSGLSSVGPPPVFSTSQVFAKRRMAGGPSMSVLAPSTSE